MCQQTLKDRLKLPFESCGGRIKDADGRRLADIYELVFTSHDGDYVKLIMQLSDFITAAMNEKADREFSEPLRWEKARYEDWYKCPKCLHEREFTTAFIYMSGFYKYCPNCGQRLDPAERK